jgi:hypothetical protein
VTVKDWLLAFIAAASLVWLAVWTAYIMVSVFYG